MKPILKVGADLLVSLAGRSRILGTELVRNKVVPLQQTDGRNISDSYTAHLHVQKNKKQIITKHLVRGNKTKEHTFLHTKISTFTSVTDGTEKERRKERRFW